MKDVLIALASAAVGAFGVILAFQSENRSTDFEFARLGISMIQSASDDEEIGGVQRELGVQLIERHSGVDLSSSQRSAIINNASTFSLRPSVSIELPASFTAECEPPVTVTESTIERDGVTLQWATDRVSLVSCSSRHLALVEYLKILPFFEIHNAVTGE